jgi:cysteine-rich repeat protein
MESRKGTTPWSSVISIAFVLALACPARAQDTCDVAVALADPGPLSIIAYALDYSGAGGSFIGSGFTPACTKLITGFENTIWDDDVSKLSDFVASQPGLSAPQGLISCIFVPAGGFPCPPASAFVVTDQDFPSFELVNFEDLFPGVVPPALTITVTPRVPVCGDGFQEGTEECDDGNVVDGDCCSSACVLAAAGTACSDGSVCTSAETCDAVGSCNAGAVLTCDDGDPCTTDVCDATLGCTASAVPANASQCGYGDHGLLALRDDAKPKLQSLIVSHDSTSPGEVGNPTVDTDYALCIYDETANVPALAARIDVPAGSGWQAINPTRFQYKDVAGSVNGVQRLRIDGKAKGTKVQLLAKGPNIPLPGPVASDRYFARDDHVTVQLRNTVGGCWTLRLSSDQRNTATEFKAKKK